MALGAVVIFGAEQELQAERPVTLGRNGQYGFFPRSLACVEVLGRTVAERMVEHFSRADVEAITIVAPLEILSRMPELPNCRLHAATDISVAVSQVLRDYAENGTEYSFVVSGELYAEIDLLDFFFFHREALRPLTRAADPQGPLDLWMVDCAKAARWSRSSLFTRESAEYLVGGYVRRFDSPGDLRQLVSDALMGRCAMRPTGSEIRPGIWVEEGAEIDRRARIVAPAFIGRNSKIQEDALITRCSNVERDCCVDYGTVIEDSSVLANTSVGIWLDLRHAVASGHNMFSVAHNAMVRITDPNVLKATVAGEHLAELSVKSEVERERQRPLVSVAVREEPSPQQKWQLGTNLIQG